MTAKRGVKSGTVVSNLCECIAVGLPVDLERLNVTKQVEDAIINVVRKPPINSGLSCSICLELQFENFLIERI